MKHLNDDNFHLKNSITTVKKSFWFLRFSFVGNTCVFSCKITLEKKNSYHCRRPKEKKERKIRKFIIKWANRETNSDILKNTILI